MKDLKSDTINKMDDILKDLEDLDLYVYVIGVAPFSNVRRKTEARIWSVVANTLEEAMDILRSRAGSIAAQMIPIADIELSKVFQSESFQNAFKAADKSDQEMEKVVEEISDFRKVRMPAEFVTYNLKYARDRILDKKYKRRINNLIKDIENDVIISNKEKGTD